MSSREFNPLTSSNTHSQARQTAEITGCCSDGIACGTPPNPGDDAYCTECPNRGVPASQEGGVAGQEAEARIERQSHSKYHREIKPGVFVDVYDVLAAWGVQNPALQHLIKKALQPGERGHKTLDQDMADIVASAKRAQELEQ